ncbi:hypothetical protein SUGI_0527890 [Cryptomeria japonica]|uniref:choline monooxygenase, chloroplastic n=1 Tax=Cryptomeria japonica TaxID=3369 RepID=UPI00240898CC|nr:choline monooxygenase, chloroplastic [Cryptomeria japonica]GLJ26961.1 hypothetical protein SUGI_0527890 [Cryptomeria japonica]
MAFAMGQIFQRSNPSHISVKQSSQPLRSFKPRTNSGRLTCKSSSFCIENSDDVGKCLKEFDPSVPVEKAVTAPSSWYTNPAFLSLEMERVFSRGWQAVGVLGQVENPHDFFTGSLGNVQFVICRDGSGDLHAFHNVCRHHAALVASDSGRKSCFVCPYHGWTYGLDGVLQKATRLGGIQNFNVNDFGLLPINLAIWGPFVLINLDNKDTTSEMENSMVVGNEWLGSSSEILASAFINQNLQHIARREYTINCNWKVFCDNYLDGGYHVPYAHGGLAAGLNLTSYSTTLFEKVSIQSCQSAKLEGKENFDRLGGNAVYAFIYPNFMVNRYGPWMDTNLVLPLGTSKCQVIFDYFLETSQQNDKAFIERSLQESERVQIEDISLCEGVQAGLMSPAYNSGRYAPQVEMAMHHFHCLLHKDLVKS